MGWEIRGSFTERNPQTLYGSSDQLFSFEIHHGGTFRNFPGRRYAYGRIHYVDYIDIDEFSVHEIDFMLKEIGVVCDDRPFYYHFMIPNTDLDFGLQALGNDFDVRELGKYIKECKLIKLYVEQGETKLTTYMASPFESPGSSKVIIEELEDVGAETVRPLKKLGVRRHKGKQLLLEWNGECRNDQQKQTEANAEAKNDIPDQLMVCDIDQEQPNRGIGSETPHVDVNEPVLQPFANAFEYDFKDFDKDFPISGNANVEPKGAVDDSFFQGLNLGDYKVDDEAGEQDQNDNEGDNNDSDHEGYEGGSENNVDDDIPDTSQGSVEMGDDCGQEITLNDDSFTSMDGSDNEFEVDRERELKNLRKRKTKDQSTGVHFYVGQLFGDREQLKHLIQKHAVETMRNIVFQKNDRDRVRAVCKGEVKVFKGGPSQTKGGPSKKDVGPSEEAHDSELSCNENEDEEERCPWVLYIPKLKESEDTWMVKTYCPEHRCNKSRKIQAFTTKFLSQEDWVVSKMESNPKISIKTMQHELQARYHLQVSGMQAYRTKSKATDRLRGDYAGQYEMLRDYILELQTSNPGTTVKFAVEPEQNPDAPSRVFKRIYICLGALKEGFKACERELLGLDGAFMKGPFPSQLLSAVGLDPNNGIYPLAYAVVEAENKDSWTWFLQNLADDLDLPSNANFTFISDRQKGIIPAIATVFPSAEHRFCLRHIHQNMKQQWRGKAFKNLIWGAATARTMPWFEQRMGELKKFDQEAWKWLSDIPPQHWSRSHFSERSHSDLLLNNLCEVFNSKLVDGREKPIISALEFVREYIMKRHVTVLKLISNTQGPLTPTSTKLFEERKIKANDYRVQWNGGCKYQVSGPWNDQCVVDINDKTCTCRKWQLTGLPCKHAIATNWDMDLHKQEIVGGPESWIHPCHWLETWKKVYSFHIGPLNGRSMWAKASCPTTLKAPFHHKPIGRPKKKRRKSQVEIDETVLVKGNKLSRAGKSVVCSICKNKGHNKRSCKGQGGATS